MSDCVQPYRGQPTRLPCPWDSPGKNTGVGCHFLLQEIFPTQGLNPGLPHCRQTLYYLSHQGSPWGDGIPVELFQILKDDAAKVLCSIYQQVWKAQQWPQDWKRSIFIPIPKKGNAKECSNYRTIALISQASKVMLRILQARLQQYMNQGLQMFKLDL